jgi:hypothetical protein
MRKTCRVCIGEITNHWYRRLLRARRERPRSGAADKRDELAPLHASPTVKNAAV